MAMIKKILVMQKISLLISVISLVISVIAIVSVSNGDKNIVKKINQQKHLNTFHQVDKIPDVEIVHPDGSREKIKSYESRDKLVDIITPRKNEKKAVQHQENVNNKKAEMVVLKNDEKNKKSEISQEKVGSKQQHKKEGKNQSVKKENNINDTARSKITGAFIVQAGAFKDKSLAVSQCNKVIKTGKLNNKKCSVVFAEENKAFRAIIYPFDTRNEADKMSNLMSREARISCLVKANNNK